MFVIIYLVLYYIWTWGEGIRPNAGGRGSFWGPIWVLTVACRAVRCRAPPGVDPTARGGTHLSKCESQSEASGRVRRIRKSLHPGFKGESKHAELDVSEKVLSGPRNSRFGFGDGATFFWHVSCILALGVPFLG